MNRAIALLIPFVFAACPAPEAGDDCETDDDCDNDDVALVCGTAGTCVEDDGGGETDTDM
jgi:hypothetical protein